MNRETGRDLLARIDAALDAASAVAATFDLKTLQIERKTGGSPVTDADLALDACLRAALPRAGEGWLSEETADDPSRLHCRGVWIVDPIDGTRDFCRGSPEWSVSIGYAWNGEAVAGGILAPALGVRVTGGHGLGVFRNGRPLTARHGVAVRDARVLASRSEVQRGEWDRFSDAAFRIEPISSIAWKLALVAAGDAEATWALGPKHEWDVAAGAALATAAGLRVRYADGSPPVFNRANPACRGIIAAPDPEHSPEWGRYWELLAG